MSKPNKKMLARILAAGLATASSVAMAVPTTAQGNLTVGAVLQSACEVQAGAISFGNIVTLASTPDQTADSGSTFQVACSSDLSPTIASTTLRKMSDGAGTPHLLPFNLSLTAAAASDNFPSATPVALPTAKDGTMKALTIYAKVLNSNFTGTNALPAGTYTATLVMDVTY